MKLVIKNGRVVDPKNGVDAVTGVSIDAGKVIAVGPIPVGFRADREVEASGLIVCPGPGRFIRSTARTWLRIQGHAGI